jgi:endonuclease/exonuclease/phosphatase (EEP) superfamily protein YafD
MNRFLATLLLCLSLGCARLAAAEQITLILPEALIARAASAVLPLPIDARSKMIQGDITIIAINDLRLTDRHIACRLQLAGDQLAVTTEIAGREIRLNVGSVSVEVSAVAEIRFDQQNQILYVKPVVEQAAATAGEAANADIGQALVALLNGREFPLAVQELDPLIAETGTKTITINTRITGINARPKALHLTLQPEISAR